MEALILIFLGWNEESGEFYLKNDPIAGQYCSNYSTEIFLDKSLIRFEEKNVKILDIKYLSFIVRMPSKYISYASKGRFLTERASMDLELDR